MADAGQAVAVPVQVVGGSNTVYYLHSDHLGSTTALSSSAVGGGLISGSTTRYYPFGAWRTIPTQTLTDRGFTGHLENMEIGLVYMRARYYVPSIGRFASADTIVPNPGEPQSFNRYSYVNNNPLRFTDPTGYCSGDPNDPSNPDAACWVLLQSIESQYQLLLTGDWLLDELRILLLSLSDIRIGLGGLDYFISTFGGTKLHREQGVLQGPNGETARAILSITFWDSAFSQGEDATRWLIIHELGHIWDAIHLLGTSRRLERETGGISSGCLVEVLGNCGYSPGGATVSDYARKSRREDWAEAFAAYMFRGSWSDAVSQSSHSINPDALTVAVDRLTFVADQITRRQRAINQARLYLESAPYMGSHSP